MSGYTLNDIPVKTTFGAAQKNADSLKISPNLYQLLKLVNGVRTVRDLLRLGIAGTDIMSFDRLCQLKLIEPAKNSSTNQPALARENTQRLPNQTSLPSSNSSVPPKGLSEIRFAVIDILLDLSAKDFGARPWVERMERASGIAQLSAEVETFCASPFGRKHPNVHRLLKQALNPTEK